MRSVIVRAVGASERNHDEKAWYQTSETPVNASIPKARPRAPRLMPIDLKPAATQDTAAAMNGVLTNVFALYVKTKSFHRRMSGPHLRADHSMLDAQADQLCAKTDPIAERIRKLGGTTLRSIGHIARTRRILDNEANYVEPSDMLAKLSEDNKTVAARLREVHNVCDEHRDIATASCIENPDRRDRAAHRVKV